MGLKPEAVALNVGNVESPIVSLDEVPLDLLRAAGDDPALLHALRRVADVAANIGDNAVAAFNNWI